MINEKIKEQVLKEVEKQIVKDKEELGLKVDDIELNVIKREIINSYLSTAISLAIELTAKEIRNDMVEKFVPRGSKDLEINEITIGFEDWQDFKKKWNL